MKILADSAIGRELSREDICAVFARHDGAGKKSEVARRLRIAPTSISDWFSGRGRSRRVDAAIRQMAAEILQSERKA